MRRESATVLLFCAVALAFAAPLLRGLGNWGILDWDLQLHHHAAARIAILEHAEIPLWNPYNGSGIPMLGHPESRVLAPTFPLTLLFGEVIALKLEIVLHLVIGMLGAFLLLRHLGAARIGACTAGILFMLNGAYALHLSVGHVWALSFAYLPWALLFYLKAQGDLRYAFAVSAVLLLTLFGGAPYQFVMIGALLATHSAFAVALRPAGLPRHARLLLLIAISTFALGAVKLLPTLELMSAHPRLTEPGGGYTLQALGNALFDRDQTLHAAFAERPEEFNGTPLHEGMYVGLLALLPFVLGVRAGWRRQTALLATLALFVWISLGQHAPIDLWRWVHRLPGFDSMRMVQRFGLVVLLLVSVFVGLGMDAFRGQVARWTTPRLATGCAVALAALLTADLVAVSRPVLADAFPIPPLGVPENPEFRQITRWPAYGADPRRGIDAPLSALYPATLASRGSTRGYRIVPIPSSATASTAPGYRGEAFLQAGSGEVLVRDWSPNRVVLEVEAPEGGRLVLNQNHLPGWRARCEPACKGAPEPGAGRVTLEVPPGSRKVELFYRPASFVVGAGLSLAALLALLALAAVQRRRRRA